MSTIEQRLTVRMIKYWDLIRKENKLPDIAHFNSAAIQDLWPNCFTVSINIAAGNVYKYEYMGDAIKKAYGRDLTGTLVEEKIKQFPHNIIIKKIAEVTNEVRPVEDAGYFVNDSGQLVKYRACFLPFGSDQKGVTHIIAGLSYRAA